MAACLPVKLQMRPEMEMMLRVMMDIDVMVDWLRADNFTSKQLTAVRKPVLPNIIAVKIYRPNTWLAAALIGRPT